ncbi:MULTISPECIES: replication initiation protein [Rhizobium]|uniref:replication initiation protein n=1 Tax=Rhizobium TaxID=379 RepID=UPI000419E47F|nr:MULTISPECIES: replication initiation protein [Rhizobium]UFS81524.1 replication initiation protein [Rhizobium sp. T136]
MDAQHYATRRHIAGSDRRGIRGDLRLVIDHNEDLEDGRPSIDREPTLERPAVLINSVRYYGEREGNTPAEAMTASVAALYQFLMASARLSMKDNTEHQVSFADAKAYLKIEKTSRLLEQVDALAKVWVSYDFLSTEDGSRRIGRRVQLIQFEEDVSPTGVRSIVFSLHPSVRKVILGYGAYTHLELGAFPKFSSKYTWRLYEKLALMAGRDMRPAMVWTPEELAEELGCRTSGEFKFSNFEARVLLPVLNDIQRHVRRFSISWSYDRADTRGRPVTAIKIVVGSSVKTADEYEKSALTKKDRGLVRNIAAKAMVDDQHMPGEDALRRAATRLGKTATEIAISWTNAITEGDAAVIHDLENGSQSEAFETWIQKEEWTPTDEDIAFDTASRILFGLAGGSDAAEVESVFAPAVGSFRWTAAKTKTLRLQWFGGHRDFEVTATQTDIALFVRDFDDIIETVEFLK